MMYKSTKKLIRTLAAILVVSSAVSCGSSSGEKQDTTAKSTDDNGAASEREYPDVNYGGAEFRILNFDQLWNMYIHLDATELSGEVLNDAVYYRNRKIEDELNCKIVEKVFQNDSSNTITRLTDHAKNSILSGDDEYDCMFLPVDHSPDLITDGYLMDLNSIPQLNLDAEWWDQDIISETTFKDELYIASGAANLMAFDSMGCLFFNESMMEDMQLEKPYDLVREGKWTIDELTKYFKAAASLNGDDSFNWSKNGSCVYGLSCHTAAPERFWLCAGEFMIDVDKNDNASFVLGSDRFYGVMDKLATMLDGREGLTLKASNDGFNAEEGGYVYVFTNRRSLFMTGEIKSAQEMRNMDDTFGIVPYPKYDESQNQYYTSVVSTLFFFTIPRTNTCVERTATIAEYLTRDSYLDVIPLYYNNTVEQKGLRNEDSIEMLEIMRTSRTVEIATLFNWNYDLRVTLNNKLFKGDSSVASDIASQKPAVEAEMQKFFDFLND